MNKLPLLVLLLASAPPSAVGFQHQSLSKSSAGRVTSTATTSTVSTSTVSTSTCTIRTPPAATSTSTALNVWWFGGTEQAEVTSSGGDDSCELVAVRIERTSANSRRIAGEITVEDTPLADVWAILTDYDRLSIHVPNLIESKIKSSVAAPPNSSQGDGIFRCRLFQKGAQKIVGFDFSATVTMDMVEQILKVPDIDSSNSNNSNNNNNGIIQEKQITFKCIDSPFFSEFDGTWNVKETLGGADGNTPQTLVRYCVDVRPKGPVPVAALEWRIREDVPTNLRAVKKAALKDGEAGVLAARAGLPPPRQLKMDNPQQQLYGASLISKQRLLAINALDADWDRDETMAKYL